MPFKIKKKVFKEKVNNIFICIRGDRLFTPLAAAQNYVGAAKKSLKHANRLAIPPKRLKRLRKDIKADIQVASLFVAELRLSGDLNATKEKLLRLAK